MLGAAVEAIRVLDAWDDSSCLLSITIVEGYHGY
jgi:hypothetical protein